MVRMMLHLFRAVSIDKSLLVVVFSRIIKDFVLVGCVWRGGRKAIALRELSIQLFLVLLNLFEPSDISTSISTMFANDILPVVLSNLDDDLETTRQNSLLILDYLFKMNIWDAETFKKVYPEILKRLDDAKDSVRILACRVFQSFFTIVKTWMSSFDILKMQLSQEDLGKSVVVHDGVLMEISLDPGHFESILDSLLIHLDDSNPQVQQAVFNAILAGKETGLIEMELLTDRIQKSLVNFKSVELLNKLI
jgi:dynein assembly factor 5, axonemal